MKRLQIVLFIALLLPAVAANATVWNVIVTDFQFSPAELTILQGDTVIWQDTLGFHSVTQDCGHAVFGQPAQSAPWTYQFIFNEPLGYYAYHCEVHPDMMRASVTVQDRGTWHVSVQNFSFTPQNITITQGDSVVWHNNGGFHDVHDLGTPSRFGNAASSSAWTYGFLFDSSVPLGLFTYDCTVHLFQGTVNVLAPPALAPPIGMVVGLADSAHVQLWWNKVCGASGYSVFRSLDVSQTTFPDSLGMTSDTTLTDSLASTKAFYLVRSVSP